MGSLFGFIACFLGDLLGFILHPLGTYLPWIGIATGLMAVFGALLVGQLPFKGKRGLVLRLALVNIAVFVACTAGITTITLNKVWFTSLTYFECLNTRLFVQGQIWNSVFNSVLLFVVVPTLKRIKCFGGGRAYKKTETSENEEEIANKTGL